MFYHIVRPCGNQAPEAGVVAGYNSYKRTPDSQTRFSPKFHQNFKKLKKWIWLLVELVSTFRRSGGINNHKVQKVIQTVDSMNKKYDHCNDLHPLYNLFRDMRVIMMYGLFFTSLTFFFFETKWFQNNPV